MRMNAYYEPFVWIVMQQLLVVTHQLLTQTLKIDDFQKKWHLVITSPRGSFVSVSSQNPDDLPVATLQFPVPAMETPAIKGTLCFAPYSSSIRLWIATRQTLVPNSRRVGYLLDIWRAWTAQNIFTHTCKKRSCLRITSCVSLAKYDGQNATI